MAPAVLLRNPSEPPQLATAAGPQLPNVSITQIKTAAFRLIKGQNEKKKCEVVDEG